MRRREFDAAVAEHGRKVFTLAAYLLGNREEAEDVVQEVLVRLWKRGGEVTPERIGAWLLRVTRNACIDAIRRRPAGVRLALDGDAVNDLQTRGPGPDALANAAQIGRRILDALQSLSEPGRSVVILREVQGLSYQEIGDALDMSIGNVRVTLHRGREKLREELREVRHHAAAC